MSLIFDLAFLPIKLLSFILQHIFETILIFACIFLFVMFNGMRLSRQQKIESEADKVLTDLTRSKIPNAFFTCPKCNKNSSIKNLSCSNCNNRSLRLRSSPYLHFLCIESTHSPLHCSSCDENIATMCPHCGCQINNSLIKV
jgi:hypothetical protein